MIRDSPLWLALSIERGINQKSHGPWSSPVAALPVLGNAKCEQAHSATVNRCH